MAQKYNVIYRLMCPLKLRKFMTLTLCMGFHSSRMSKKCCSNRCNHFGEKWVWQTQTENEPILIRFGFTQSLSSFIMATHSLDLNSIE